MSKLRVESFMMSVDGFSAGPEQDLENPLGKGGGELGKWFYPTRTFQKMLGKEAGTDGVDEAFAARGFHNIGASIMGRNMFGPQRGAWSDESWKGWWGPNPPYHTPVFVMTHFEKTSLPMEGGTVFNFVSGTPAEVLAQAKIAAAGKDIRLNGGVQTLRNFLKAGLVDHLHLVVTPVVLGQGEKLLDGLNLQALGYKNIETVAGEGALHLVYQKY